MEKIQQKQAWVKRMVDFMSLVQLTAFIDSPHRSEKSNQKLYTLTLIVIRQDPVDRIVIPASKHNVQIHAHKVYM